MNYLQAVEGSPLIPPELATLYFIVFLIILAALYAVFHYIRKPYFLSHKIIFLVGTAIALKAFAIVGGTVLLLYWIIPKPQVVSTVPAHQQTRFPLNQKIEVLFDRPVSRKMLEKSISPELPGVWVFEDSLYSTHLYRKLVFYPTFTLKPDTRYTITLSQIKNLAGISRPFEYSFAFTTQAAPASAQVSPARGKTGVRIDAPITVTLDAPNDRVSELDFEFIPPVPFDLRLDSSRTRYTLEPKELLRQGTEYRLKVRKSDVRWNIRQNTVFAREPSVELYNDVFTTKEAPGIAHVTPSGVNVFVDRAIIMEFSQPMERQTVENNLTISPAVTGTTTWRDDKTFVFTPQRLAYETGYKVRVSRGARDIHGGYIEENVVHEFSTIGRVKVERFDPENNWKGVGINNPIRVTFDQQVNTESAESSFSIEPPVAGSFSWEENTLTFHPAQSLPFTATYTVTIAAGVQSIHGQNSTEKFTATFTTQDKITKLNVPVHLQQYTLSCEIAALRMALLYRGVDVSEDRILELVGFDPTPHANGVWGDPYEAFVGNVRGTQMADGYGVYWPPIARAARSYRNAQDFSGWTTAQLTETIAAGNPVVVWTYSKGGRPTTWKTPSGKEIYAVSGEHAVTAVGFVGTTDNPTDIIINDPLIGQVYLTRSQFENKWGVLHNSGVVVY